MVTKILLIDDEDELLAIIAKRLQRKGVECVTAANLTQARVHFGSEGAEYTAIISDLFLGRENGLDFYEAVRKAGYSRAFVLTTGDEDGDNRVRTFKRTDPLFHCLQKPYALEMLIDLLLPKAVGGF